MALINERSFCKSYRVTGFGNSVLAMLRNPLFIFVRRRNFKETMHFRIFRKITNSSCIHMNRWRRFRIRESKRCVNRYIILTNLRSISPKKDFYVHSYRVIKLIEYNKYLFVINVVYLYDYRNIFKKSLLNYNLCPSSLLIELHCYPINLITLTPIKGAEEIS